MASIYVKDDAVLRAREQIRYDFLAADGSESRDAAAVIEARFREFCKDIPSSDDYLDFKLAVEALSHGTNTVILDDIGLPSVMVLLPKMNSADLSNGLSSRTHPGFIVNGREYETVAVGKYLSTLKNGRAYSLPYKTPASGYDYDTSVSFCTAKGEGWNVTPYSLWGAIALWCKKNGTMPEGNTNFGQFNDNAYSSAPAADTKIFDGEERIAHTLTGAGPLTWNHNGRADGIADLCGNVFEWCSGFRWCNGELQVIPNADAADASCDTSYTSERWRAILPDGSLTSPGDGDSLKLDFVDGHWRVSTHITSHTDEKRGGPIREMDLASNIPQMPQILIELGICPERIPTCAPYGNDIFWGPNKSVEQFPCRGANWYEYIYGCGGVFRTSCSYGRDIKGDTIGFRLVYYK